MRAEPLAPPKEGEVLVRTLFSGVSRGTERLVLNGGIARSEWQRMRAPLQVGAFPFPVKYGYCATGRVEAGAGELLGRNVFVLHPHQDRFVVPARLAVPIPDGIPPRRATLAANMETALNAVWDSGAGPADRIVVVGAGIVGLLVGYLAGRLPAADVTLVDIADDRRALAEALGVGFSMPGSAPEEADVVFHTSATAEGLDTAIRSAGLEGNIVELSWFGDAATPVRLGGAFHSRRLKLVSSQVGHVAPSRRPRWGYRRRLEAALRLLDDPALDALLSSEISFEDAPAKLPALLAPGAPGLAPVIRYPQA
ncbi:MAG TPA: zinc-binding alcohol dehydrogenase [Hyphomicrobiaceae bacterium]|nr:zinc-binding alcohol dehydrogenase [Hyphomicrobiaceae bacterium]